MKTRAAVLYAPETPFVIEELDLQEPQAGEVLVNMKAAGVCHSDWHLVTGDTNHPLPELPGQLRTSVVSSRWTRAVLRKCRSTLPEPAHGEQLG